MNPLSAVEQTMLGLKADGLSYPEIAERTNYSLGGVKHHLAFVRAKLGAKNTPHAITLAARQGWLK